MPEQGKGDIGDEQVQQLVVSAKKASDTIKSFSEKIRVVSHYDCDGICSAAIITRALVREGKEFHLSLVKQLNEDILSGIAQEKNKLVLFLDMGSGQIENIQKYMLASPEKGGPVIIISDHHQVQGEIKSEFQRRVFHVNPVLFGIEENISGAGMTYLIARAMSSANIDLSELGIIGAIGDSQIGAIGEDWGLMGLNKEILKDAEKTKKISVERGLRLWGRYTRPIHKTLQYSVDPYIPGISDSEPASVHFLQELGIELKKPDNSWRSLADLSDEEQKKLASGIIKERIRSNEEHPERIFGDVYTLIDKKDELQDANEFATILNACGKNNAGHLGIFLCLNDFSPLQEIKSILESYRRDIGKALSWLEKHKDIINTTDSANYIIAGSSISEHIISNVTSIASRSNMLPAGKPTFAFVDADGEMTKISSRMDNSLIKSGLDLKELVSATVQETGGEGGGHSGAAGATIPRGKEQVFINTMERLLTKRLNES
jgi:RecJ-like exonuclease